MRTIAPLSSSTVASAGKHLDPLPPEVFLVAVDESSVDERVVADVVAVMPLLSVPVAVVPAVVLESATVLVVVGTIAVGTDIVGTVVTTTLLLPVTYDGEEAKFVRQSVSLRLRYEGGSWK
jgi:hypothetical protein